ncbi:uncharacterized protein LOC105696087 [Orussus abietinus]|uniref:uncharacterized protein LOC105696087 n=1 Tax=Orussus abietinus TaxID=222816 RepID=UPI00062530EF|nr:uncharacterized protein LOC105696087 [Orussus abietinus]
MAASGECTASDRYQGLGMDFRDSNISSPLGRSCLSRHAVQSPFSMSVAASEIYPFLRTFLWNYYWNYYFGNKFAGGRVNVTTLPTVAFNRGDDVKDRSKDS